MEPISKDQAHATLDFLHAEIAETVYQAWEKLVSKVLPLFPGCTVRCKRNQMYDLMIQKARTTFHEIPGVKLIETKQGRIFLAVNKSGTYMLLRFKKIDDHFHTSNYPTQGSLDFDNHEPELPEIPVGARVTIGYLESGDGTTLESVHIFCSHGNRLYWEYPLSKPEQNAEVIPLAAQGKQQRRVRAKKTAVTDIETARKKKHTKD